MSQKDLVRSQFLEATAKRQKEFEIFRTPETQDADIKRMCACAVRNFLAIMHALCSGFLTPIVYYGT